VTPSLAPSRSLTPSRRSEVSSRHSYILSIAPGTHSCDAHVTGPLSSLAQSHLSNEFSGANTLIVLGPWGLSHPRPCICLRYKFAALVLSAEAGAGWVGKKASLLFLFSIFAPPTEVVVGSPTQTHRQAVRKATLPMKQAGMDARRQAWTHAGRHGRTRAGRQDRQTRRADRQTRQTDMDRSSKISTKDTLR
jgi:hypothetical protein